MAATILDKFVTIFEYKVEGLEKVEKISKKLGDVGKTLTRKVTAPVVAGFGGMIFAATKFESGLDNVLTLLSKPEIAKYKDVLAEQQKAAVRLGFGLSDVNKALFDNVSVLGMSERSAKNFEIAQKLAIAGVTGLGTAVKGQRSILTAYENDMPNVTEVANAFFSAQKAGATTVADLADNVGKVAPIAAKAGVGFKTLLASMSELTRGGLSTEMASTALLGAISSLISPTTQAQKVLKKYKIPMGLAALQTADFTEVLLKLAKAAKENPDALAEMIPERRALTAVAALGEKKIAHLRQTIININQDTKNGTGLLEAYTRQINNTGNSVKKMRGQLQVAAKILGDHLIPLFLKVTNALNKFFKWIENLSPATQKYYLTLLALAAAIGPILIGISALINAFISIKGAIIALKAAQIGLNTAMYANPFLLTIAAIAVLVTWFATAYAKTGSFTKALQLMSSQLLGIGQRILKFLVLPLNLMISTMVRLIRLGSKIPGLGKLKTLANEIKGIQGSVNKFVTGSSSANPFASREQATPFNPLAATPISAIPPASVFTGGAISNVQDNRSFDINVDMNVNEVSDGKAISDQFAKELQSSLRNTTQNFATKESVGG